MTRRRLILFGALLGSLLLFPIGLVIWNEVKLATGTTVFLEVQPIDPNDPFKGEYVMLSYPIARARRPPGSDPGETIYVVLTQTDPARALWATPRKPSGGVRFIRGRVEDSPPIEFGIESFFVEEGQARRYEEAIRRGRVFAKVVLDDDGGARLDDLVIR